MFWDSYLKYCICGHVKVSNSGSGHRYSQEAKELQVPDLWDNTASEKYNALFEVSFLIASKHTGGM